MSLETLKQSFSHASDWADSLYQIKAPSPAPQNPYSRAMTGQFNAGVGQNKLALTKEQYEHNRGRVYSAIRVPCQRIAGQQVFVARVNTSGDPERSINSLINKGRFERDWLAKDINPNNLELIDNHPICDVIDRPNELMVRAVLWNMTVANLLITGRSLWVLAEDSDGNPQIAPIPSHWAKPVSKEGKMFFEWKVSPPGSMDDPITVAGDRMAHFYFADPSNPFGALSPLQMIARAILADEAISEAQWVAFSNGAFPSHALIAGDVETADGPEQVELEPSQKDTILNEYRQRYGGVRNFGLPMIFDAIIKDIKRLSDNPLEMAFLDSSGLTKTQIYENFGVNPISAGQVEGANRASSAVADEHLLTNTINPIIELISQGMTKWLSPLFAADNERLKIWIAPAETRDAEMLLKKWDLGRQTFAMTRNEVRTKLLGLPEREGFDDVIIPLNMVPGTINPNASTPATTRDAKVTRKKQIVEMWMKQHSTHELPFAKAMESFFVEQRKATISALEEMGRDFKSSTSDAIASNVFNPTAWDAKLLETVEPFLLRQMFAGAATELSITHSTKQFDDLIDVFNPSLPDELIEAIRQFFDELIIQDYWKDINRTTLTNLSRALETGILEGDTISEMSNRVFAAMGDDANRHRAARIARSETTGALNAGHHATRQMLASDGSVVGSEWLTVGDIDVRGNRLEDKFTHVIMHEVKVKIGKDFDVSGEKAPYPGHHSLSAGNRINCRCVATGIVDPNELVSDQPPEDVRERGRGRRNGKPKKRKRLCEVHR